MKGFVFPGQGSQFPGMGRFLFDEFKTAREVFEESSDAINYDLKKLCFDGSESDLALTENTQPALLCVSIATFRSLMDLKEFKILAYAGHSVGEYAALVASQALPLSEAIKAVRKRGQAMQNAVPVGQGAMAAVMGLTPLQVVELCQWVEKETQDSPLEPANFNAPGQIVISGKSTLLQWLTQNFKKENAEKIFSPQALESPVQRVKFIPLKVSAPFHCSMMKPAEEIMRKHLETIALATTKVPVVQNFTALPTTHAEVLRENVIRQISAPVRWIECVEKLNQLGCTEFIEVGSGSVLSGLIKKILGDTVKTYTTQSMEDLKGIL